MSVVPEVLKRRAAEAALPYVRSGMTLGLGTGSTVAHLLDLLGEALGSGDLSDIVGVPTSSQTEVRAREAGIELKGLSECHTVDLTIDGADEISPELDLVKGAGGALLREKMVAQASQRLVIIADGSKRVERLGSLSAVPIEVISWGLEAHVRFLQSWGADVSVRASDDGRPVESDNGLVFLDCRFEGGIGDPVALERALADRAGIVETGLFLGLADEAIVASEQGVATLRRDE